ncbi:META domain-containing protein [Desulfovibrio sp. OttesenSCG-928-G15]|nr:META domain-containing protein [Desulfovibrio sp. OttesenSCG-928-G15]
MNRRFATLLLLPLLTACAATGVGDGGSTTVTDKDLLHHRYVLQSINGKDTTFAERTPELEFNEGMRISGLACNRFAGPGTLKDGVLTVPNMVSTMMMCHEPERNDLERKLYAMLRKGARLGLADHNRKLTLSDDKGTTTLVYTISDWVK